MLRITATGEFLGKHDDLGTVRAGQRTEEVEPLRLTNVVAIMRCNIDIQRGAQIREVGREVESTLRKRSVGNRYFSQPPRYLYSVVSTKFQSLSE